MNFQYLVHMCQIRIQRLKKNSIFKTKVETAKLSKLLIAVLQFWFSMQVFTMCVQLFTKELRLLRPLGIYSASNMFLDDEQLQLQLVLSQSYLYHVVMLSSLSPFSAFSKAKGQNMPSRYIKAVALAVASAVPQAVTYYVAQAVAQAVGLCLCHCLD